jgi:hypothetical protein
VINPVFVIVLLPAALVAVSVTVYVPMLVYICEGLSAVAVLPSPNDHIHDVGVLVDSSIKSTSHGAVPEVAFAANAATGVEVADTGKMNNIVVRSREKPTSRQRFLIILLPHDVTAKIEHEVVYT